MQVLIMPPDHQDSQHSGYGGPSGWNVPSSYSASPQTSMSPMHEFPGVEYYPVTPMPQEPSYNIARPSPFATTHAPMPPPLIMPHSGLWPSMLASQPQTGYQTPIMPAGPLQTPLSASTASDMTPTSAKPTPSRRKLTDDERRQMCIEAEQNPTMKQTQIGAKFNVERSTVSKILRQREKYMNPKPKEDTYSPEKKSKAKLPDFEKTLTKWVRNQHEKGLPISDEDLRKQALVFSFSRDDQAVVSSIEWLEKFKRKNQLLATQEDQDSKFLNSATASNDQSPSDASPDSSNGLVSPPMSAIDDLTIDSGVKLEGPDFFDFATDKDAFENSPMGNDLATEIGEAASNGGLSRLSPRSGRNESEAADLATEEDVVEDLVDHSNRQRSQTFSHTSHAYGNSRPSSAGQRAPSLPVRSLTSTQTDIRASGIDPRQMMKRHKSVPDIHYPEQPRVTSMQPPPLPISLPRPSAETSPISHPASPLDDELIRSLHEIKLLLEQSPTYSEPDDYLYIGKLMHKIKLIRQANALLLPGGMHAIDVMDSPRISKKRTILGIST